MSEDRVGLVRGSWTLLPSSVFAEQESLFHFVWVCFSESEINVKF